MQIVRSRPAAVVGVVVVVRLRGLCWRSSVWSARKAHDDMFHFFIYRLKPALRAFVAMMLAAVGAMVIGPRIGPLLGLPEEWATLVVFFLVLIAERRAYDSRQKKRFSRL